MKVKFANGFKRECSSPTEHKSFLNDGKSRWVLNLRLLGATTSAELDELLTKEHIAHLEFLSEVSGGEDQIIFTLDGYERATSSSIRHAEDTTSTVVEIQLIKGE